MKARTYKFDAKVIQSPSNFQLLLSSEMGRRKLLPFAQGRIDYGEVEQISRSS